MKKIKDFKIPRRQFIKSSMILSSGIIVGCSLTPKKKRWPSRKISSQEGIELNAWIQITPDNQVIFALDRAEMGQGIMTSHATIVGEELDVDPADIHIVFAQPNKKEYGNPAFFNVMQVTGGSTSTQSSWEKLSKASAKAKATLIKAAAKKWDVWAKDCVARDKVITHAKSGKTMTYGEAAKYAGEHKIEDKWNSVKDNKDYRWVGKPVPRLDVEAKVKGEAQYGMDITMVDMKVAVVIRPPVRGSKVSSYTMINQSADVRIVQIPSGLAVVSDSYWKSLKASKYVTVKWSTNKKLKLNTNDIKRKLRNKLYSGTAKKVQVTENGEDRTASLIHRGLFNSKVKKNQGNSDHVEAIYEVPYLPHATMEPMNCTAWYDGNSCSIWVPTQMPDGARNVATRITGLPKEKVFVYPTYIGGGFGRRIAQDYVNEAVEISRVLQKPIKVVWTREDDFTNDFYRPASTALMKGSVNGEGEINYWYHRIVSDSVLTYAIYDFLGAIIPSGWTDGKVNFFGMKLSGAFKFNRALLSDTSSFEGADKAPYYCQNKLVEYQYQNCGVPLGFWRSVGHSQTIFMVESFMDELAHSANINPYNFRIDTIKKAFKTIPIIEIGNNQREELERSLRVIEKVGAMSGITSSGRNGRFQGIAQARSFGSYCAQVVEIQMVDGKPKIEKVYCAIDCGQIVNPDIIKAQMEGSIIFGLTAALKQEITIKDGVVEQTNFNNSDLLRMYETPEIVVEIIESDYKAGGVGEPGVPPVAPALCNAIYLATNKRIRSLPIKEI